MEERQPTEGGVEDAAGAQQAPGSVPPGPEAPPGPETATEVPAPPAVQEQRKGEFLIWRRWKGSLQDIGKVFRLAQELIEQATDGKTDDFYSSESYTISLRGRERSFSNLEALENEIPGIDLDSVQGLAMYYWTDKVNVSISIDSLSGSYLTVRGEDPFAVAGLEAELKTAMDRGRRWSQVGGWPEVVAFWAPWVAILGLSLIALSNTDIADTLGKVALAIGGCLFATVLFMRYVEPRLVPTLELLSDSEPQTVAQVWKGRVLKGSGIAAAAVVGAAINGLTGFLF